MTFADRVLAMAIGLGYKPPVYVTEHAFRRWAERWCRPAPDAAAARLNADAFRVLLARAEIEGIAHKEKATIWVLPEVGAKVVVSEAGTVMTVLPPGATRGDRRPVRKKQPPMRRRGRARW